MEKIVLNSSRDDENRRSTIRVERVPSEYIDRSNVHTETNSYVINHQLDALADMGRARDLRLEFTCWLRDQNTGQRFPEARYLAFWFRDDVDYQIKTQTAYDYFKELLSPPEHFPKDHASFFQKMMRQMRKRNFHPLSCIQLDLEVLDPQSRVDPDLPQQRKTKEELVSEQLLLALEQAYPNVLDVTHMTYTIEPDEDLVMRILEQLETEGLVQRLFADQTASGSVWVRKFEDKDAEVKPLNEMPRVFGRGQHPSIAIITYRFCEKQAIDAMLDDYTTYVRYATHGEQNSHMYTIGFIGPHKVVTTKLPTIGRAERDRIAASNTTTRLLGTFPKIEHVFILSCSGGVPHYMNYFAHPRLGDVIVSFPSSDSDNFFYISCEKLTRNAETNTLKYKTASRGLRDPCLLQLVNEMRQHCLSIDAKVDSDGAQPWVRHVLGGLERLEGFGRPPADTDRLYMSLDSQNAVEVAHPQRPDPDQPAVHLYRGRLLWAGRPKIAAAADTSLRSLEDDYPTIRFGRVGAGKPLMQAAATSPQHQLENGQTSPAEELNLPLVRQSFAERFGVLCFGPEFDAVLDSIDGNRKDSFLMVSGVADYVDGSQVQWQPWASLCAAAYVKSLLLLLPQSTE